MAKSQHPQSPEKQLRKLKKRRIERENAIADLNAVESIPVRVDPHVHRQSTRMPPRSVSLRSPETTHDQDKHTPSSMVMASLPLEIIDLILEEVVPMDHLFRGRPILRVNSSGVTAAWKASMKMKMNILLVCKTWAACGYRFLYRHITLLSFSDVEALARKLNAEPALGNLVRSLTFLYHCATVNKTKMEDECANLVAFIVNKCPRARHLEISTSGAFFPTFGEETAVCIARGKGDETLKPSKWQTAADELATALPPQITSLALGPLTRDWDFSAVMLQASCSRLVDLRVPIQLLLVPWRPYIREKGAVWNGIQPRLVFPNLRTLQLRCQGEVGKLTASDRRRVVLGVGLPGTREVSVFPDMPNLAHLVFIVHQPALTERMRRQNVLAEIELCLNLYGNGLEYLQFPAMSLQGDEYARLLQKCPRLAHVVLPAVSWPDDPASIFPSVMHVDLWCSGAELESGSGGVDVGNLASTVRRSLPEVKTIRRLSTALQNVFVDAFPRALDSAVTWIRGTLEVAPGMVLTREEHTEGVSTIRMLAVSGGNSV
ncbi:hypothetical protein R3P38DRAFT_3341445 [Favolaschia claudopus]|uniref:F-box domain-containing protein n=1 Tax=Favolaschia claudopus TaxID=2862362 RepID=A0AAW0E802_9AGAR